MGVNEALEWKDGDGNPVCSYLLVTNADNLYSRHLMSNLNSDMQREVDMLGVWFISHYTGRPLQLKFNTGRCDLGAVLYRASILRAHPEIRFCTAVQRGVKDPGEK